MRPKPLALGTGLILLGTVIGLYNFAYMLPLKMAMRGQAGLAVPGSLVSMKEEMSPDRKSITYVAQTSHTANGQQYGVENTYDMVQYFGLKADRNAVVRYLKRDPRTAFEIHSKQADMSSFGWCGFVTAGLTLPGILLLIVGFSKPEVEETPSNYALPTYSGRKPPRGPLA